MQTDCSARVSVFSVIARLFGGDRIDEGARFVHDRLELANSRDGERAKPHCAEREGVTSSRPV